jgi:hypothetical protein
MAKFQIDLSAVTAAAAADANAMCSFEDLHMAMLEWHMIGQYPTKEDVIKALKKGYASNPRVVANADTLDQYASGIRKWSRAGKVPKAHSMRAFMASVPGAKGKGGRPPKAKANPAGEGEKATVPNDDKAWVHLSKGSGRKVPGARIGPLRTSSHAGMRARMIALIKGTPSNQPGPPRGGPFRGTP